MKDLSYNYARNKVLKVLEGFMGGSSPDNPLIPNSQKRTQIPNQRTSETYRTAEDMVEDSITDEEGGLTDLDSDAMSLEDLGEIGEEGNELLRKIGNNILKKVAKLGTR